MKEAVALPAICGDLDAGDHDLLVDGGCELPRFSDHLFRWPAALRSSCPRDDAEGATHVAAVLYLEERAGVAEGQRHVRDLTPHGVRKRGVYPLQQAVLLGVGHHQVDAGE